MPEIHTSWRVRNVGTRADVLWVDKNHLRAAWHSVQALLDPESTSRPPTLLRALADHPPASQVALHLTRADQGSKGSVWVDLEEQVIALHGAVLAAPLRELVIETAKAVIEGEQQAVRLLQNLVWAEGGTSPAQRDGARRLATEQFADRFTRTYLGWLASLEPATSPDLAREDLYREAQRVLRKLGAEFGHRYSSGAGFKGRPGANGRRITSVEALGWFQAGVTIAFRLPGEKTAQRPPRHTPAPAAQTSQAHR